MSATKIIHQTWKDEDIPDNYPTVWQDSWKEEHPDWEYRFWTDDANRQLVADHYGEFLETYDKIVRGVVKSEIARMLYLHRFGGMYVDLDFICLRSMNTVLEELGDFIVVGKHAQKLQPLPNAWMYSPPGENFWLVTVHDSIRDWESGQRKVEQIAGPDRLKWCLEKYDPHRVELPCDLVYPFAWGNTELTQEAMRADWQNLNQLRECYPRAYAVTRWCHNW